MSAPQLYPALSRRGSSPLADELSAIFAAIDDAPLLGALAKYRWTGRPGWSLRALWRSYVAAYVLGFGTTNQLIRRLQDDPALRAACGFSSLPSRWTFNRFLSRVSRHADLVEDAFGRLTDRLHELLPDFGNGLAVDGSVFRTWSNPDRKHVSDPDASWTGKKSNKGDKMQWWFGYKLHLVVDPRYELPVAVTVTTASDHDSTQFVPVLEWARWQHPWLHPAYVAADAGYDGIDCYTHVVSAMKAVAVIKTRHMRKGHADDIADEDGTPYCVGGQAMTFLGYREGGKLVYRCPAGGCPLKDRKGVRYCDDDEVLIDPQENLRRFALIPRATDEWKALYAKRTGVERCFSRLKGQRALDSHCRRGLRKVTLHALMSVLTMQAAAVVRAERGEVERIREVSRRVA